MIDTQVIRSKILDLAMRGQLTEQLPEDGTAEELYQQIQKEKQKLIKAGKIKKEKPLPEITADEMPFEIPSNWKWIRLNELGVFCGGKTPSMANESYWKNGSITWVTSKDMKQKYINASEMMITEEASRELTLLPAHTVVFVVRSGILRRLFPVAILLREGTINQDLKALKLFVPEMCEIVYYILKCFETTILFKYAKDGTTVNNIIFDSLLTMPIPLPPLAEQHRIVARIEQAFSALDTIDALQAQYADNLTVLKSKLIDAAIQGKLTEQLPEDGSAEELYRQIQAEKQALIKSGKIKKEKPLPEITADEIPFEIPANWKWVRLGDYCQKITDQVASGSFATLRENVRSLKTPDYAIMVKTADFSNGFTRNLTYTDKHGYDFLSNSNLFGGELILSNVGSVGKCFIVPKLPCKMTLAPNAVMVRMMEEAGKEYLYHFLISSQGFMALDAISTGVAVKKFNKTELKKVLIPLPPLAEQKRIVERLVEVLKLVEAGQGGA